MAQEMITTVDHIRSALNEQDRELTIASEKLERVLRTLNNLKQVLHNAPPQKGLWSDICQHECIDELEKVMHILRDKSLMGNED